MHHYGSDVPDRTGYDPQTETLHAYHDFAGSSSVGASVLRAVACLNDKEAMDIQPLYDVVDPDALDALFAPVSEETARDHGSISFTIDGRLVTFYGSGEIVIDAADEDPALSS